MTSVKANRKRVLGIVGSPRRGGNTEIMVDEALAGAKEAGASSEKVILNELDITPCQACDGCRRTGECVQRDDILALLEQMERSQVWVFGTPVYWWGPTGQFKVFIDRWYGSDRATTFRGKRVILAIPLGGGERTARHTVGMLTDALAYLGVELFATVLAPGAHAPGEVRQYPNVLAAIRRAGREAIETSK